MPDLVASKAIGFHSTLGRNGYLGTVASEHFTGLAKLALPLICITIGMPTFLLETIWFFFFSIWIPSRQWTYIQNCLLIFKQ